MTRPDLTRSRSPGHVLDRALGEVLEDATELGDRATQPRRRQCWPRRLFMSVSVVHAQPTVTWTRALAGAGPGLMAMLIMMLMASVLIAERACCPLNRQQPTYPRSIAGVGWYWRWVCVCLCANFRVPT